MKNYVLIKIRFSIFIFLITISSNVLFSQKFVNEFLNIGVSARAHGMSSAVVASTADGTSGYWNPAGLVGVQNPLSLNAMHSAWFGGIANFDYFSIARRLDTDFSSVASLSIIRLGVDNIPNTLNLIGPDGSVDYNRVTNFSAADYAGLFSYARSLDSEDNFSIGGTIKVIHRTIGAFGKAWGFGADIGARWKYDNLILGLTARDITTTFNAWSFNLTEDEKNVFRKTNNEIPVSSSELTLPRLILGAAYLIKSENINVVLEGNLNISSDGRESGVLSGKNIIVDPAFGGEIGYADKVFVRLGVGNIQRTINPTNNSVRSLELQPNVGLGLKFGKIKIDYALANIGNLGGVLPSHIFSVGLDFAPRR